MTDFGKSLCVTFRIPVEHDGSLYVLEYPSSQQGSGIERGDSE